MEEHHQRGKLQIPTLTNKFHDRFFCQLLRITSPHFFSHPCFRFAAPCGFLPCKTDIPNPSVLLTHKHTCASIDYAVLIPSLALFFCTVFYHIQKAAFFQYFSSVFLFRPLFSFHFAVHYNSLPSGMPFRITWPEGHQRFLIPDFSNRVVRITKNQKRSLQICRSVKDLQRFLCIILTRKRPRYNANTTMISEIVPVKTNLRAIRIFKWLLRLKCHSKHVRIDHTI